MADDHSDERPPLEKWEDSYRERAVEQLRERFEENRQSMFYSRQLEVQYEREFFHWVTNNAIHDLRDEGLIKVEKPEKQVMLLRHKSYRYHKRQAKGILDLVGEYSDPDVTKAVGERGEQLVLEGFARKKFVLVGRNTREYRGKTWTKTDHNLDFIFEKEDIQYGVEVKNTLGYSDLRPEILVKRRLCEFLGIRAVFVVRYLPKTWMNELFKAKAYGLLLRYQLYPPLLKKLAKRVREELGLPVDTPGALADGTMQRVLDWHSAQMKDGKQKGGRKSRRQAD